MVGKWRRRFVQDSIEGLTGLDVGAYARPAPSYAMSAWDFAYLPDQDFRVTLP